MSRSVQFIGLNNAAEHFLNEISYKKNYKATPYILTTGYNGDEVIGTEYSYEGENGYLFFIKEVEQMTVFDSGPMIFTNLQFSVDRKNGLEDFGTAFSWGIVPLNPQDEHYKIDHEKGIVYESI